MHLRQPLLKRLILCLLLSLTACVFYQKGGTYVWIDVPINGLILPEVQPVKIEGHAASPRGVQKVEIWVDDVLFTTIESPPMVDDLAEFEAAWSPAKEGQYRIQALAYGTNNAASEMDSVTITFGGTALELTATQTPTQITPERTETITATLSTATQTTTATATFTPTRATPTATVTATTAPNTPTPTLTQPLPDTTAPPAPEPAVPADGLSLSCRATQALAWLPVTDPSGVAAYQVEIQRSPDNANWSAASGSPVTGLTDKTTPISTECGWYYRWRVRAVDGEGNESAWSAWSYFTINLE